MSFYHRKKFLDEFKMRFQKVLIKDCRRFPIRKIDMSEEQNKKLHDKIVELVTVLLSFNENLHNAHTDHGRKIIQRQIETTDRQIDKLVYQLYGLKEEEIQIVETTTG